MWIIFSKSLPGRLIWEIGRQSEGLVLFVFVFGIGVTLLIPHFLGNIPFCNHELYKYVNSKVSTSKASLGSLEFISSMAEDFAIQMSFTSFFISGSGRRSINSVRRLCS